MAPRAPAGRAREAARLREALADPDLRLIELAGPAGSGKTALLAALEEDAVDVLWLFHACRSGPAGPGSGAVGGLLEALGARLDPGELREALDAVSLRELAPLCPGLLRHAAPGAAADAGEGAGELRHAATVQALHEFFQRLGRGRRTVLAVDDWQSVDARGRRLLADLAGHPGREGGSPVLLVAHRGRAALPFAEEWGRALEALPERRELELEPLDGAGMAALVADVLDASVPLEHPEFVEALRRRSQGLPFFAHALLRRARREGRLRATLAGWIVPGEEGLAGLSIGRLLRDQAEPVVRAESRARFLLAWLAALRAPASLDPLRRLPECAGFDWEELADRLAREGVLERAVGGWAFAHALWIEEAGAWLEDGERADFLERVADALDPAADDEAFLRAGLAVEIGRLRPEDGSRAAAELAGLLRRWEGRVGREADRVRAARELLALAEDAPGRSLAFRETLRCGLRLGDLEVVDEAVAATDPGGLDREARRVLLLRRPLTLRARGRGGEIAAWIRDFEARDDLDGWERAQLALERLLLCHVASRWENAGDDFERLAELALDDEQAALLEMLRIVRGAEEGGGPLEAFRELEALYRRERGRLGVERRQQLLGQLVRLSHLHGQRPLLYPWYEDLLETGRQAASVSLSQYRARMAHSLVLAGRTDEAAAMLAEDLAAFRARGQDYYALDAALRLVSLHRQRRRLDEAAALAAEILPLAERRPADFLVVAVLLTAASVFWRAWRAEEALRCLELARPKLEGQGSAELWLSFHYCDAMARLQRAEEGEDWAAVLPPVRALLDLYRELGRSDTETMQFAAVEARALLRSEGGGLRRAADFRAALEAAPEREFDLARFLVQVALLAGEEGDGETRSLALGRLSGSGSGPEAYLLALERAAAAERAGDGAGAAREVLRAACLAGVARLPAVTEHLERRFPGRSAHPLAPGADEALLALWLRTLGQALVAGEALRLPGLAVAAAELPAFAFEELRRLEAPLAALGLAARRRLEGERARLEEALAERRLADGRAAVELKLFGGPRLAVRGRELPRSALRTRLGLEALALLAMRQWAGRGPLPAAELLERLGEGEERVPSGASLRVLFSRLRKALAEHVEGATILGGGEGYRLADGFPGRLDLAEFERLRAAARSAELAGDAGEALRLRERQLEIYEGPLLAGVTARWAEPLRAEYERRFVAAARAVLRAREAGAADGAEALRTRLALRHPELAEALAEPA